MRNSVMPFIGKDELNGGGGVEPTLKLEIKLFPYVLIKRYEKPLCHLHHKSGRTRNG